MLFNCRISMIMAFAPANCFQPPKTVLASFRGVDRTFKMGDFEYFREKAWQAKHALDFYMKEVKYRLVGCKVGWLQLHSFSGL